MFLSSEANFCSFGSLGLGNFSSNSGSKMHETSSLLGWKQKANLGKSEVETSHNLASSTPMLAMSNVKKAQKLPNFRTKNVLLSMLFFFFHVMYSSCPRESKNAIKNEKCLFSPGHRVVCPTYKMLQKVDVATNDKCQRISRHLADITTCLRYVYRFPNKGRNSFTRERKWGNRLLWLGKLLIIHPFLVPHGHDLNYNH